MRRLNRTSEPLRFRINCNDGVVNLVDDMWKRRRRSAFWWIESSTIYSTMIYNKKSPRTESNGFHVNVRWVLEWGRMPIDTPAPFVFDVQSCSCKRVDGISCFSAVIVLFGSTPYVESWNEKRSRFAFVIYSTTCASAHRLLRARTQTPFICCARTQ